MTIIYRPDNEYTTTVEAVHDFTVMLLTNYEKSNNNTREKTIRNFIARGTNCLNSIHLLWKIGNIQDCWILYRTLVDRLFHLRALGEKDEFEIFEKWSFIQKFEYTNRVRSDPNFNTRVDQKDFFLSEENKKRYKELKKESIKWIRPKAENIAKESFEMPYLYSYAYDYASGLVHPMADDGEEDFRKLTQGKPLSSSDKRVAIHNSVLIQSMILQEGLNVSKYQWRAIAYDFIDQCRKSLITGEKEHIKTLNKLIGLGFEFEWYKVDSTD